MWERIRHHFRGRPGQGRVARVLLEGGIAVREGDLRAGKVAIGTAAIARVAQVDRRVVDASVRTICADPFLTSVFGNIEPVCALRGMAAAMGWGVIEIVPRDATRPGILAEAALLIAEGGLAIRQAILDDPGLVNVPRAVLITDHPVPARTVAAIRNIEGMDRVILSGAS